jgi:hypothetical protein
MENMMDTLRNQVAEDKERLRQEHQRLLALQSSIEAERANLHSRSREDAVEISKRREESLILRRLAEEEREKVAEEVALARRRLEAERQEFVLFVNKSTSASESAAAKLRDEEHRLNRIKDEVAQQRSDLAQQRAAASVDLASAADVRAELQSMSEEVTRERQAVDKAAREVRYASEALSAREEALHTLTRDLGERERILRDGFQQVSVVGESVLKREFELKFQSQQLSLHQVEMDRLEEDLAMRRVSVAASQREMLKQAPLLMLAQVENDAPAKFNAEARSAQYNAPSANAYLDAASSTGRDSNDKQNRKPSDAWRKLKSGHTSEMPSEVKLARKTMQQVRSKLASATDIERSAYSMAGEEKSSLSKLSSRR